MNAIKGVEGEVEKVLRLFSECRDNCKIRIDEIIESIENAKKEMKKEASDNNQDELNPKQKKIIQSTCDIVQKLSAQILNNHRSLHIPVSKIGKSIDKNFSAEFASVCDKKLFQSRDNQELLNLATVQHFLRHGYADVADVLTKEAGITIATDDRDKFNEVESIVSSLRQKDTGPALAWAIKNKTRLRELNSPLEFKIHRINIIELYKQGVNKQAEIIQYARDNLQHFDSEYNQEIRSLIGGIAYLKAGVENSPYKSLLDPLNYYELEEIFLRNAWSVMELSVRNPISVAVEAGTIGLPALLNLNQMLSNQGVPNVWQSRDELPVEIDLGRNLQFHSTFSCPILKQHGTESNPPMRLVCGHVISRDALNKLSGTGPSNKFKCPYCPHEQVVSDSMQIHF